MCVREVKVGELVCVSVMLTLSGGLVPDQTHQLFSKDFFWPEIFFNNYPKIAPKFSAFFIVFVGKEILINIVQN